MNIASYVKTAKTVITANSPVLLLGTTIAGVVTTGVLAAKAGWKARGIVDAENSRRRITESDPEPLTNQDIVRLTWLCYAVPAVTGASTIASAVGIHTIHTKRANAMAALYAVTSTKLDDYTEKAQELLGPKKTQELNNDAAQKSIDRGESVKDKEVLFTDQGKELCHEDLSGRYFLGSVASLENGVNEINRKLIEDGECTLNDFNEVVGLPYNTIGSMVGWTGTEKVRGIFGSVTAADGRPAIDVRFQPSPKSLWACP